MAVQQDGGTDRAILGRGDTGAFGERVVYANSQAD